MAMQDFSIPPFYDLSFQYFTDQNVENWEAGLSHFLIAFVSPNSGDEDMEEVELVAEVRLEDVGALSCVLRRNRSWRMQKSGMSICAIDEMKDEDMLFHQSVDGNQIFLK